MSTHDQRLLDLAGRLALRGMGWVEPNPMVGCVIADPAGRVLGAGFHRRFGGAHAEIEALGDCARRGADPRGATAYVTLEPCDHQGKTGPCAQALIRAGVARVVYAVADPHELSGGGAATLRAAGVDAGVSTLSDLAVAVSGPFRKRVATGLPWVIAKWAATIDGKVATRTGASQWISSKRSRRFVHRMRGRVDAILTGVGTVLADDPTLTARCATVRRVAMRVVADTTLRTPVASNLVRSAAAGRVAILTAKDPGARGETMTAHGVDFRPVGACAKTSEGIDLEAGLRWLAAAHDVSTVWLEAGPRLMGSLFRLGLIDELHVFTGPIVMGDDRARSPLIGGDVDALDDAAAFRLATVRRLGDDIHAIYRSA